MRRIAILTVLSVLLFAFLPYAAHQGIVSAAVNCCQYALILSDIEPRPGESVAFTGIVTDQYGVAEPGVQVMYHETNLNRNVTTDSSGVFHFILMIPQYPNSTVIHYAISMNDAMTSWHDGVADAYSINFGPRSGNVPVLYYSQGGGRGSYISVNSPKFPAIIYVGGGYELDFLHGVNQLDSPTQSFLDYLESMGFNVIAPVGWVVATVPSFPLVIGALLKHGFAFNRVYLLGWSAGGVAAAWALTRDFNKILDLAVIMDAELTGPSETATHTDYAVFNTAQFAGQVGIPHLLIWGRDDTGATGVQTAAQWITNAKFGLARLDPLSYSHNWIGTPIESSVRKDLIDFYHNATVGQNFSAMVQGNDSVRILSKASLRSFSYNASMKTLTISTAGESGAIGVMNLAVPVSMLDGEPVATIDNIPLDSSFSKASGYYYIFFTYPNGLHTILIGGKNVIPEFASDPILLVILVLIAALGLINKSFIRDRTQDAHGVVSRA